MGAWLIAISLAWAPASQAARRLVQELAEAFGREAVERVESRIVRLVEAHGDEAAAALRRAGPAAVPVLEAHGATAARLVARWGDEGMRLLAAEGETAIQAVVRWGDRAAEFMIRHPGVGKDLLEHFGEQALRANVSTEGAILLGRLAGPIQASGRAEEIFGVVERFGDRACQFLWRNKGTVFTGALLAAFLADPKPYLDGVRNLVVEPAAEAAREAVRGTNWTVVFLAIMGAGALAFGVPRWLRRRKARGAALDSPGGGA